MSETPLPLPSLTMTKSSSFFENSSNSSIHGGNFVTRRDSHHAASRKRLPWSNIRIHTSGRKRRTSYWLLPFRRRVAVRLLNPNLTNNLPASRRLLVVFVYLRSSLLKHGDNEGHLVALPIRIPGEHLLLRKRS
jgi:hypothetical protein